MSRTYRRHVGEHLGFRCYPRKRGRTGDRHVQKNISRSTRIVGDRVVFDWGECSGGRWNKRQTSRHRRLADAKVIKEQLKEANE